MLSLLIECTEDEPHLPFLTVKNNKEKQQTQKQQQQKCRRGGGGRGRRVDLKEKTLCISPY